MEPTQLRIIVSSFIVIPIQPKLLLPLLVIVLKEIVRLPLLLDIS